MKRLLALVLAMLAALALVACGDEDTESSKDESKEAEPVSIVGTWKESSFGASYTFGADGKGAYNFGGADMEFTYTDDGKQVTIQYTNATEPNVFGYTIKGNELHIEDSFGSTVIYVKQ